MQIRLLRGTGNTWQQTSCQNVTCKFERALPIKLFSDPGNRIFDRAFSTVVADVQFSALGTVLVATLARLAKATGIDRDLKTSFRADKVCRSKAPSISLHHDEDLGEILSRKPHSKLPKEVDITESNKAKSGSISETASTAGVHTRKSKKRKKKDAIDDLFKGLL